MAENGEQVAALRATAHPLRLQMLSVLTGASMSAAELARELGTTQANASYHLRVLAEAGEVVPDGEVKVRGGTAKRYRHPWDQPERPGPAQAQVVRAIASELVRRYAQKAPETRAYFCDAEMWVTPEVWAEATEHVRTASALIHDRAQSPRAEGTVHVNLQMAAFHIAGGDAP